MTIELYPIKVEGYDDQEPVFLLEALDDSAATVRIDTCVNAKNWPELSAAILTALKMMRLPASSTPGEQE